jgi:N-acetylneuraminate synthase (EC 2.5.1.56)
MQKDFNVSVYLIECEQSIANALRRLSDNKQKILFVCNDAGVLKGVFADGDFRRWVVETTDIDLDTAVIEAANKQFVAVSEASSSRDISALFSEKIGVVPLLDSDGRVQAIARPGKRIFSIGDYNISDSGSTFIIAEIGNNHNGSVEEAKRLVDSAIASGADCVKFQMRDLKTCYVGDMGADSIEADLGTQYVLGLLERFQLSDQEFAEIFKYCEERSILAICTPFDLTSADKLQRLGVVAYKVSSADLTNHELLQYLAAKKLPLIVSTGMSDEQEIVDSVALLEAVGAQYLLLHCNSTYPCPDEDVNLNYIKRLRDIADGAVGYSGHERGINVPIAAVALGAKVIEKHFTHDKTQEGNDHRVSLLPEEFRRMVEAIRQVEVAMGTSATRKVSQGELMNREVLAKSVVAAKYIKSGEIIEPSMLKIVSPGKGLPPYRIGELIGRVVKRSIEKDGFFYNSDISDNHVAPRKYFMPGRHGIPVRFHDVESLCGLSNFNFVEFHFSHRDLDFKFEEMFEGKNFPLEYIVHAPELFGSDHVLDLCSEEEAYRLQSIEEMRRVIDVTKRLRPYFIDSGQRILIVVNVGGFSREGFLSKEQVARRLSILDKSLAVLDETEVEIIPQTMPPFPWHFGGQQYHNLFVDVDQVVSWCSKSNRRVCVDVSHTALACEYLKVDLIESLRKVSPFGIHYHIADASGTKQEGLQIGEGDVSFLEVFNFIERYNSYWLPEIWQGHKNRGEGFWTAFDRLEDQLSNS